MPKQLGDVKTYDLPEIKAAFNVSIEALRDYCRAGELPARNVALAGLWKKDH